MPLRVSFLFQLTTDPEDVAVAQSHIAGWSESHWDSIDSTPINSPAYISLAQRRALMLPRQAAIIGWKQQKFTLSKNKAIGGGVATFKQRFPGSLSLSANVPQDALMFSASIAGGPNAVRFNCRAVPDEAVVRGEFNNFPAYKQFMDLFRADLVTRNWGALVRDLAQPSVRVKKILNNVITVEAGGGFAQDDYVILRRVRDVVTNEPISGSFLITLVAGNDLTVVGLPAGATAEAVGFARKDVVRVANYTAVNFARVVTKKVGSPFERYRGRRSKQRV
jgi:hypothetical protein